MTERVIINPKNNRRLLSPIVVLSMLEKAGNVIAPARDRRNSNKITVTVFINKEPRFIHVPSKM